MMGDGTRMGIVVVILALSAVACLRHEGGTNVLLPRYPQAYEAYDGETRPLTDLAVVETGIGHAVRKESAFIRTIDGRHMPGILDGRVQVHVEPGTHTFGLGFGENRIVLGAKSFAPEASVTFDAEAGHAYRINGWRQRMKGSVESGRAVIEVVDATTGAPIVHD